MFTLWRKLEKAENLYFRPFARFSSNSLSGFNQLELVKAGKLTRIIIEANKINNLFLVHLDFS